MTVHLLHKHTDWLQLQDSNVKSFAWRVWFNKNNVVFWHQDGLTIPSFEPAPLSHFCRSQSKSSLQDKCVIQAIYHLLIQRSLLENVPIWLVMTSRGYQFRKSLSNLCWCPRLDSQLKAPLKVCVTCQSHDKAVALYVSFQSVPLPELWEKIRHELHNPVRSCTI